jgi:hypothetical protein
MEVHGPYLLPDAKENAMTRPPPQTPDPQEKKRPLRPVPPSRDWVFDDWAAI